MLAVVDGVPVLAVILVTPRPAPRGLVPEQQHAALAARGHDLVRAELTKDFALVLFFLIEVVTGPFVPDSSVPLAPRAGFGPPNNCLMSFPLRYAILLDGGFVIKKLQQANRRFPTADEIEQLCLNIAAHPQLSTYELLRNYFYHASPAKDVVTNPLDRSRTDLGATPVHAQHESLLDRLEMKPNFSIRLVDFDLQKTGMRA